VRDAPRWEEDQYQCAEAVIDDGGTPAEADDACGAEVGDKLAPENPAAPLGEPEAPDAAVTLLDLTPQICPDGRCPPVLGDVFAYMADNHLTRPSVAEPLPGPATAPLER